jgi:DNA transposition AAA+ family ATPase
MTEAANIPGDDGFVLTPTVGAIWALFDRCAKRRHAGLVLGWPGVGKTTALRHYLCRNPSALGMRVTYAGRNKQGVLSDLCGALKAEADGEARTQSLYNAALRELTRREPREYDYQVAPSLLVLDEANHLSDAGLEVVRDLHDQAEIGIVLLGNVELRIRLERGANRWTSGYLPLLSRITSRMDLKEITRGDLAAFAAHHGLDGPSVAYLAKQARQGGLRTVNALILQARDLAGGGTPGLAHLKDATAIVGTLGGEG